MHINCGEMHSDLDQSQRDEIMYKFKSGQIDVLVATDIVARGIDIDDIAMVINYDVPHDAEDYVHRIGRTARANKNGTAITLIRGREIGSFMQIEKFLERTVDKLPLPEGIGEGPEYKPMPDERRGRGGRGGRGGRSGRGGRGGSRNSSRSRGNGSRSAKIRAQRAMAHLRGAKATSARATSPKHPKIERTHKK